MVFLRCNIRVKFYAHLPKICDPSERAVDYAEEDATTRSRDCGPDVCVPSSDEVRSFLSFSPLPKISHLASICRLLADWIRDYPCDFAVRGTAGALSALVKSIVAKTYLIHYGQEFLPFLETLPNLVDRDASWALKTDSSTEESDDSYSMLDEEEVRSASPVPESPAVSSTSGRPASPTQVSGIRERKHSLPLSRSTPKSATSHNGESEYSHKHILRELQRISVELFTLNPMDVAQEITRIQKGLFLSIEVGKR